MFDVQHFLIVDDERSFRSSLTKFLSVYAEISEAENLSAARKLIQKKNFDVFLLDKKLSDGSGLELIPLIQKLQPHAAIVVVSGDRNLAPIYQAIEYGIDDYVVKGENLLQDLMVRIPLAVRRHRDAKQRQTPAQKTHVSLPESENDLTPEKFQQYLDTTEKNYLQRALELSHFEVAAVAKKLGIARSTMHKKISDYAIDRLH
jgi:DNA-binding NtrC family response regulator